MIEELKGLIRDDRFKVLLNNPTLWQSLDIDYETPRVERVWIPINNKRLSLHVIHPCEAGEALLHPHVWESAMYVLPIGGLYEHTIGCQMYDEIGYLTPKPTIVCKQIVEGPMYYEMMHEDSVHSVRPIAQPVFTIMLTGKPIWSENACKVGKNLVSLSDERKKEILLTFKNYFE